MALRRPAAQVRKPPAWRRSGYESTWESLIEEEGRKEVPGDGCPPRSLRPQSAIEGGQLDSWLEHLQRMQKELLRVQDQVPALKEPTERAWKRTCSGGSSSCGSPGLQSSYGSQDSLQTTGFSPPECEGSWERAHITQAASKEQAQISSVAPVKIGWLPIQRRVTVAADSKHREFLDSSAGQVKLKQPITPTIQTNPVTADKPADGEVERSERALKEIGVKAQKTPDRKPPVAPQVPEKRSFLANVVSRSVSWQALRRGWNTNRGAAVSGGSQSSQPSTGTNKKFPLAKTNSPEPLEHAPHPTTSADYCKAHTQAQGTNTAGTHGSSTQSSVQPVRATTPVCRTSSSSSSVEPSHTQASSTGTTIIPQNKAGFSSITISSRKVSRSGSFSGFHASKPSTSPPVAQIQAMDPNSSQFTVQRKATIVKVTEQRVTSSPGQSSERARTPPAHQAVDTLVHRRKATIIKVTERRESYGNSRGGPESRTKHPDYRHSFTEENSTSSREPQPSHKAASSYQLNSTRRSPTASELSKFTPDKGGGMLHRSTLSLFVSSPPAAAAPTPTEPSLRATGRSSGRSQRPASCYANVCGYTGPRNTLQPPARRCSFELSRESGIAPVHSSSHPISPPEVKEAGQLVANTLEPSAGDSQRLHAEPAERRMSPSLTLIKAPDPQSSRSPDEVLALNAAAIIANIKLQRQLSKKTGSNVRSETDSSASLRGSAADGKWVRPYPDRTQPQQPQQQQQQQQQRQQQNQPHVEFVPLAPEPGSSPETCSLQEALQRSRPDFINRSQSRVRKLERRRLERRELVGSSAGAGRRRVHSGRSAPLPHNDNLFKPRNRVTTGTEMALRSKRAVADVKKKEEEERKKKELCLSNRQRMELFKKRLLDQILQRNNS